MVIGSYFLTIEPDIGVLKSFKVFARSYYVHIVLVSLLFYSISGLFDRAILHSFATSIPVYIFFLHFFIAILFICFAAYSGIGPRKIFRAIETSGPDIVFGSFFTVGYIFFQMKALQLVSVGLVSAIKRSSSFFTTLIGGELFHERNLKRKLLASAIIIVGTLFIVF
jgi:drug/metabolite transporter (DMT)-like permease